MIDILMLIAGLILAFWFIGNALGFLMTLLVAGLVGFAAESLLASSNTRYGWLGAIGAGLLGSLLGPKLVGHIGPSLMGLQLVPALAGAVVLVMALTLVRRVAG